MYINYNKMSTKEFYKQLEKTLMMGMDADKLNDYLQGMWLKAIDYEAISESAISKEDCDYYWEQLGNKKQLLKMLELTTLEKEWVMRRWKDMVEDPYNCGRSTFLLEVIEAYTEEHDYLVWSSYNHCSKGYELIYDAFDELLDKKVKIIETFWLLFSKYEEVCDIESKRQWGVKIIEKHFLENWWNPHTPLGKRRFEIERKKLFEE